MSVVDVIRVVLGLVMLAAGIGKLANRSWPDQARLLGAPLPLIPFVAPLEVVLGAALVAGIAVRVTAGATAGLLAMFTMLLVLRLRQGAHPSCACFGGRRPRPIDGWSVVRNLVLIAGALTASTVG